MSHLARRARHARASTRARSARWSATGCACSARRRAPRHEGARLRSRGGRRSAALRTVRVEATRRGVAQ
eukprot:3166567-Prymnesium_polylepis.1